MPAALGLLLGLALAADGLALEAGVAAEARSRSLSVDGAPWLHTLELAVFPRAGLVAERGDLRLSATYAPRLVAADTFTSDQVDVLHEVRLAGRALPARWLELTAAGSGASGTTRLIQAARRPDATAELLATASSVTIAQLEASLAVIARADPRTAATAELAWSQGGGVDAADRILVPVERRLRLDAELRRRVTRLDALAAVAWAEDVRFAGGDLARFALLSLAWRRQVEAGLEAWGSGGGGVSATEHAPRPAARRVTWAAEAGVQHTSAPGLAQRLVLRASPAVDRLTGAVDRRAEAELGGDWVPAPAWRVGGRAVATLLQRAAGDAHLLYLDVRLDRAVARRATLGAGLYATRQETSDPALPSFLEVGAFLSAAWTSGPR